MELRFVLLARLRSGPKHGYALAGELARAGIADPATAKRQVYRALAACESAGWVQVRCRNQGLGGGSPFARKPYELTKSGINALGHWAKKPVRLTNAMADPLLLRIFALAEHSPDLLEPLLDEHSAICERALSASDVMQTELVFSAGSEPVAVGFEGLSRMALAALLRARIDVCRYLLADGSFSQDLRETPLSSLRREEA